MRSGSSADGTRDRPGVSCGRHGAPSNPPGPREPAGLPPSRPLDAARRGVGGLVVIGDGPCRCSWPSSARCPPRWPSIRTSSSAGRSARDSSRHLRRSFATSLQRRLDRLRVREGIPGVSVAILFPDGTTWLGTSGLANVKTGEERRAEHGLRGRERQQDVHGGADHAPRARTAGSTWTSRPSSTCPRLAHRPAGHRAHAARPHERPARLLLRPAHRQGAAGRPRQDVGRGSVAPLRRQAVLQAGQGLALLEHELPRPGADRRARRRPVPRRPTAPERGSSCRSGSTTRSNRSTDRRRARSPTAIASTARPPSCRPVDLSDGIAMAPFTSVVTAAGAAGSIASTPDDLVHWVRALYGGDVLDPASLRAMVGDVALTADKDPTIPYGLGVQALEFDGHPTLGHSGRLLGLPRRRPLAPAGADRDRRPDQPEPIGPVGHRALAAPAGPDAVDGRLPRPAATRSDRVPHRRTGHGARVGRDGTSGWRDRVPTAHSRGRHAGPTVRPRSRGPDARSTWTPTGRGDRQRHGRPCRAAA